MAVTRADTLTGTRKQREFFSDFMNNLDKTPIGDQIARVVNERSVEQAFKNLIKTNQGERLFQPSVGSDIYNLLFEQNTAESYDLVELFIRNMAQINEPRVNISAVNITPNRSDDNAINIVIEYNLINNPEPITLNLLLKRVR